MWCSEVVQDQLKIALLEATDLFEETWSKTRDSNIQNKVYNYKEAVSNAFHLDTLKLAYIRKQDPKIEVFKVWICVHTLQKHILLLIMEI